MKTKSIEEFLSELKRLGLAWWKTPEGRIRSRPFNLDPVTELYRKVFRRPIRLHQFMDAGLALGLSEEDTLALVVAADGTHVDVINPEVRQLLEALLT